MKTSPRPFFRLLAVILSLASLAGCKSKPKFSENSLPLPPGADSGLYDGQFIQTDYGFGIPLPPKWLWLRLSAEQEVDEVARFSNATNDFLVRLSVQQMGPSQSFSRKFWEETSEQDLKNHLFKIQKKESTEEWKTQDSGSWIEVPFRVTDSRGAQWLDQEWALQKGDLMIGAHAMIPQKWADTEPAKKILKALQGSLTQIHWYDPIGPRGISIERFELQHFNEGFRAALESGSLLKTNAYFDEMYPDRSKWNLWYQKCVSGDPKSFTLKAELSGLIINGDYAVASFGITRKDKNGSQEVKSERNFKLSKKEGAWKITASLDKN